MTQYHVVEVVVSLTKMTRAFSVAALQTFVDIEPPK